MRFRGNSIFKKNEMTHCVALYSEAKEGGTKRRKLFDYWKVCVDRISSEK